MIVGQHSPVYGAQVRGLGLSLRRPNFESADLMVPDVPRVLTSTFLPSMDEMPLSSATTLSLLRWEQLATPKPS